VTGTIEDAKAAVVHDAAMLANDRAGPQERDELQRFITKLYQYAPPSDVAARSAAELHDAALALWRFAVERSNGAAKVRVYNPSLASEGWSSANTIVEIVNDDMPFLVDSVRAAINESGREVRLVIHPMLAVARDAGGKLLALDPAEGGRHESWMQIAIAREPDAAEREALARRLAAVLEDVRRAVVDWRAMRRMLHEVADAVTSDPPPLARDEIEEGVAFLRWLDDDNFTYLGFRDYVFAGDGETAREPLGVLADASFPVFGALRDLPSLPPDVQDFLRRRELLIIAKTLRRATVHRPAPMDAIGVPRFNAAGDVVGLRLFLGLFTSAAYSRRPGAIPLLRQKVERVMGRSGLALDSHDGKALQHILETFPRDELLQIT